MPDFFIGLQEPVNLVCTGDGNPMADFARRDYTYKDLGDLGKDGYNFPSGAVPGAPSENESYLELFDLDKPLNGDNSLFPMISPPRTFLGETLNEDSFFPWRGDS